MRILSTPRTAAAILAGLSTLASAQIAAAQTNEAGAEPPRAVVAADPPADPPASPPPAAENETVMTLVAPEDATDAAPPVEGDPKKNRISLSGGGGYGLAFVTHPDLVGDKFGGPIFEFHLNYSLRPAWTIGLEFMSFESQLKRIGNTEQFQSAADALHTLAGSEKDRPPRGLPGLIGGLPLHVHTVGATLEFTPMDYDGLYLGTTLGAAIMHGVSAKVGGALVGRGGYRIRIIDPIAIAVEGGAHAQVFDEASAVIPYGELQLRLFWPR
jgi:hypothetical protein